MLNRRGFLGFAAWGAASVLLPRVASAKRPPAPAARHIALRNLHTDESCAACYWSDGEYDPAALGQIEAVLRDHRTGEIGRIAPRLVDLVHALTVRLGNKAPVHVVSGYRSAATNALLRAEDPTGVALGSLHLTGAAVDISFEARPLRQVREAALELRWGGVGYYPASNFVHLDIGRPRFW